MIVDPKKYSLFDYNSEDIENNHFKLGEVVINDRKEIGVVIQLYDARDNDLRTDMFGNYSVSNLKAATIEQIKKYRPEILPRYKVFCNMTLFSFYTDSLPEAKIKAYNYEAVIIDRENNNVIYDPLNF